MRTLCVFCCLFTVTVTLAAEINVEGTEGGEVSFTCSHKLASNNKKYLCKEPCGIEDKLVDISPGEIKTSGRITLVDSGDGSFTVSIKHLELSDSQLYYCAVIRSLRNTFTSVNLTVHEAFKTTVPPIATSSLFPNATNSRQTTHVMGTSTTRDILKNVNGTTADGTSINLSPMLYAAAGTTAALIIFILTAYFRKRRESLKPQLHVPHHNKDPRSKVRMSPRSTCLASETDSF